MAPDDATLAKYPEEFAPRRSRGRTIGFTVAGGVFVVLTVLAVVFFAEIRDAAFAWEGRRSGLAPVVAPGAVVLCAFLAVLSFGLLFAESTTWVRTQTGTAMRRAVFPLADDATADAVHERLRSGDPGVYRPIPVHRKGRVSMRLYRADADATAYITMQAGRRGDVRTWPLITFTGPAWDSLRPLTADTLTRPPGGFDAMEQSLRDVT